MQPTPVGPGELAQAIAEAEARFADRPAVGRDGIWLSFAGLMRRVTELSGRLDRVLPSRSTVAIVAGHDAGHAGANAITALLAVWHAGHVAVVLPPDRTAESLAELLEHSLAAAIVADSGSRPLADLLAADRVPVIMLDAGTPAATLTARATVADLPDLPHEASAIVYTSGSTGQPRGVLQSHACMRRNAAVHIERLQITPDDRALWTARSSTISGTTDLLRALLAGACLIPADAARLGWQALADVIRAERPTIVHLVPTVFRRMARRDGAAAAFASVRILHLGGEAVTRQDFDLFVRVCPRDAIFVNNLGCTEVPTFRQTRLQADTEWNGNLVPLLEPIDDREVLLLDSHREKHNLIHGSVGEIAVRTFHAALGYWRDPGATGAAFRPLADGRVEYRTGDLAHQSDYGPLTHLGRLDSQVRMAGKPVYPDVLAERMRQHPGVAEAAVVTVAPLESNGAPPRLVAFCSPADPQQPPDMRALRRYMLWRTDRAPISSFVLLDSLPALPGGKLDMAGLRRLAGAHLTRPTAVVAADAFRTPTEEQLAAVWRASLDVPEVTAGSDFFDLGGDSMSVVDAQAGIARQFGVTLDLAEFIRLPCLRDQAARIAEAVLARAEGRELPAGMAQSPSDDVTLVLRSAQPGAPTVLLIGTLPSGTTANRLFPAEWGVLWQRLPELQDTSRWWTSTDDVVRQMVESIRAVSPQPTVLFAWSFAGLIAWLVAARLDNPHIPCVLVEPTIPTVDQPLAFLRRVPAWLKGRARQATRTPAPPLRRDASMPLARDWDAFLRAVVLPVKDESVAPQLANDVLLVGHRDWLKSYARVWRRLVRGRLHRMNTGKARWHAAAFLPENTGRMIAAMGRLQMPACTPIMGLRA